MMKKIVVSLVLVFILFGESYSQGNIYKCEDTLLIKITHLYKGNQKSQQMIKVFCSNNMAFIKIYDKYKVQVVPKEGLDKERLAIAEMLIKTKSPKQLPEQYRKYLAVSINDSLSVLKLLESYGTEKTFNQLKSTTIDCLKKRNEWLIAKIKRDLPSKNKRRTKVEFIEGGKSNIYFLDNYYKSKKIFKCLFK